MAPSSPAESPLVLERLPADVSSVAAARRAVVRFVRDLEVDIDGIVLAVSEAVSNAVVHAYGPGQRGVVEVTGATAPDSVTIVVRDRGRGLAAASEPGAGFGLRIIRRLAERVDVAELRDGLAVTMRFRRGGAWSAR